MTGFVKRYDDGDGYGFIIAMVDSEQIDVFVHAREIVTEPRSERMLFPGDEVEFDITHTEKGWRALSVNLVRRGMIFNRSRDVKSDAN